MSTMRPFVRIGLLVTVMTGVLLVSLFAGRFLDHQAISKEFKSGTFISGIEIGGLTPAEARIELEKMIEQQKDLQTVALYLYDSKVELSREALVFTIPDLDEDVVNLPEQLEATVDTRILTDAIKEIESADVTGLVDSRTLKNDIENQVNQEPMDSIAIHLAPYIESIDKEKSVISNVYTPYLESTLLHQWAVELDGFSIEPRSNFSLKEALKQTNQVIVGGESLNLLSSAVYQVLAKSNLELIEHHSPDKLPYSIEIGYSASVNEDHRDLVFYNPNYEALELKAQYSEEGLIVELIGTPFLNSYELVVNDIETITPRKEIRYSKDRRAGDSQLVTNGKQGYAATMYRKETGPNNKELSNVKMARDYVAATPDIEERSAYAKPEPETELNEDNIQPVIVELPESSDGNLQSVINDSTSVAQPKDTTADEASSTKETEKQQEYINGVNEPVDEEQNNEK